MARSGIGRKAFGTHRKDKGNGSIPGEHGPLHEGLYVGPLGPTLPEVDAFFDALDYLVISTAAFNGFPCNSGYPLHRETGLRLPYPRMSQDERDAAVKLLSDLTEGTLAAPATASGLQQLFQQHGLANHFARGRGNW